MSNILVNQLTGNTTDTTIEVFAGHAADSTTRTNLEQGLAKAWVNFNGTSTLSVRDSLNIDSVTDNGTGNYTNNFSSAFAAETYNTTTSGGGNLIYLDTSYGYTTSAKTFRSAYPSNTSGSITVTDGNDVNASHHGDLA